MIYGMYREEQIQEELERLEYKLGSARILGKDYCTMCGVCCNRRTCVPTPAELIKIAEYLNMDIHELINRYYAIDRNRYSDDYFLKPIGTNIKDLAGKFIPSDRTYDEGPCIFLENKDNKTCCKIYPVRPQSAIDTKCWIDDDSELLEYNSWKDNAIYEMFGIKVNEFED